MNDKIREEFEKWYNTRNVGIDNPLYDSGKEALFRAYSARDDEVLALTSRVAENNGLREEAEGLYESIRQLSTESTNLQAENKKLKEDFQKGVDLIGKDEPTCQEWNEGWKILKQALKDTK